MLWNQNRKWKDENADLVFMFSGFVATSDLRKMSIIMNYKIKKVDYSSLNSDMLEDKDMSVPFCFL